MQDTNGNCRRQNVFCSKIVVKSFEDGSSNNNNSNNNNNNNNNNNSDDLLTDPLLNYINYNYKINQIKLFTNYTVNTGLTESNYSKTN